MGGGLRGNAKSVSECLSRVNVCPTRYRSFRRWRENAEKCQCPVMQALTFKPSCTPPRGAPWFCKVQKEQERLAGTLTSFPTNSSAALVGRNWKDYSRDIFRIKGCSLQRPD